MMYEYRISFADFTDAQRLFRSLTPARRLWFFLWLWIAPVAGGAALLLLVWDTQFNHLRFLSPLMGGVCAALAWIGIFTAVRRPFQMRTAYKRMNHGRPDQAPRAIGIEQGELVSRVPGFSEGRFKPAAIRSIAENDRIMILFVSSKTFLIMPKGALPESAFVELRRWHAAGPGSLA